MVLIQRKNLSIKAQFVPNDQDT